MYFFLGKGFESVNDTPQSDINETSFLLWMEEVKMWLRNRYKIFAWVKPSYTVNENTFHPKIDLLGNGSLTITTKYDTYEDALMHTLYEVRKYV